MYSISTRLKTSLQLGIVSCLLFISPTTIASHHFESMLAQQNPQFDLTDLFVFESEKAGYTSFMIDINPTTSNDGKALFAENGVYNIHIAKDRQLQNGGLTITAYVKGDALIFGIVDDANPAVGSKGKQIGSATIGQTVTFKDGIRVWSGAARDPFVGNSAGIIAFREKLAQGKLDLSSFKEGVDLFASLHSSIIVVEVPNSMLPKQMYVYASSAMYLVDKWVQVNRLANPLMTHLFMANNPMEIAEHVGHRPDMDLNRSYAVSAMVLRAITLDKQQPDPVKYADQVAAQLLPDMIPYQAGTKAIYSFEVINGRKPSDDAMDAVLSLFMGRKVTDNANTFDRHPKKFPYVVPVN